MIPHNVFLSHVREAFREEGFNLRYVGGCVRDWLCGKVPKDVDLCTDARPEEQIAIYRKHNFRHVETGLQHGTLTVVNLLGGTTYEITSLRLDVETDGRHAKVEFTSDWSADLGRRDLTINAMAMDFDGRLYDPFGGADDLKNGIVRFVGDARTRIREDYLRILRFFRFLGRFGNLPDDATLKVLEEEARGLQQISVERIWSEVSRIIVGPQAEWVVELMHEVGVSNEIGLCQIGLTTVSSSNPVTQLVQLGGADDFPLRWKMSGVEERLYSYLVESSPILHRRLCEYLISVEGHSKTHVVEACRLHQKFLLAKRIEAWTPPQFPVNGHDLIALGYEGKAIREILQRLKRIWWEGEFKTTREDLLDALQAV